MNTTENVHVKEIVAIDPPHKVKRELAITPNATKTVTEGREAIKRVLHKQDNRLLVIVGPCSIHDVDSAKEYASRLCKVRDELDEKLLIVMRTYFEKPRTTIGWKGYINDPNLDNSCDMLYGIRRARQLLLEITDMGLPTAMEMVDPISPQYVADLVCWTAIGARTTESQPHRIVASGLSMPIGLKNNVDGNVQVAVDAIEAVRHPHSFFGIDDEGRACIVRTTGNPDGHIVLRGARTHTNYDAANIQNAAEMLVTSGFEASIMVDCSHSNSRKDHRNQESIFTDLIEQRIRGNRAIMGIMLESNLREGNQKFPAKPSELKYGVSITDACISFETTERLLKDAYKRLSEL